MSQSKLSTTNYPLPTLDQWLMQSILTLKQSSIKSARLDCLLLLEAELKKPRMWVIAHPDIPLSVQALNNLNNKIARRAKRVPLAYLLGSKEFYGRTFIVTEDVLIPRPETEAMIDLLNKLVGSERWRVDRKTNPKLHTMNHTPSTVIDVGTGSGCLAITAKLEFPQAKVVATDISKTALAVARKNAAILEVDIELIKSNLLSSVSIPPSSVLLANLPYVPEGLITSPEITKEPALALFAGKDGLELYKEFWLQIAKLKNKPAVVITESLENQHARLHQMAAASGYRLEKTDTLAPLFILKRS